MTSNYASPVLSVTHGHLAASLLFKLQPVVLNKRRSVVDGLDLSKKELFIYGTAELNADEAYLNEVKRKLKSQ